MEEATGAPSSFAVWDPKRLRASGRDGQTVMTEPPSPLRMLLSRHTRRREVVTLFWRCSCIIQSASKPRDYPDMSLEIERKFLVANEGWKTAVIRSVRISDWLLANNKGHKARVRIANDVATIALKSRRRGPVRTEFEYAIPYSDAEEMLRTMCDGNVLDKVRHFVSHEGNNWHVDVYEGLLDGVVLA